MPRRTSLKFHQISYTVESQCSNSFPLDMLRYDNSFPATEQDAHAAARDNGDAGRQVKLLMRSNADGPNADRWRSFGWLVIEVDGVKQQGGRDPRRTQPLPLKHSRVAQAAVEGETAHTHIYTEINRETGKANCICGEPSPHNSTERETADKDGNVIKPHIHHFINDICNCGARED